MYVCCYIMYIRIAARASILLLPLLGTGWLFGVLTVSSRTVVFQYVFALVNSSQGLLLFICHCVYNTEVRTHILGVTCRGVLTPEVNSLIVRPQDSSIGPSTEKCETGRQLKYVITDQRNFLFKLNINQIL